MGWMTNEMPTVQLAQPALAWCETGLVSIPEKNKNKIISKHSTVLVILHSPGILLLSACYINGMPCQKYSTIARPFTHTGAN